MSLQIVLHRFRMPDGWACDTFGPPGAARPFHIVVRPGEFGADARLQALTLGEMLHAELVKIYENPQSAECPGVTDDPQEHLIVLTSNGITGTIFDDLPFHGQRTLLVLPASLQSQAAALSALIGPGRLASFWTSSLAEVIPAILANAGITWERPRIFISYRRDDTQGLAAQLFHALAEENFDVFLDQFRLPPGLELLARIRQELGDKTMVVVLESANLRDSPWVRYEVRVAQTLRTRLAGSNGAWRKPASRDWRGAPADNPVGGFYSRWSDAPGRAPQTHFEAGGGRDPDPARSCRGAPPSAGSRLNALRAAAGGYPGSIHRCIRPAARAHRLARFAVTA